MQQEENRWLGPDDANEKGQEQEKDFTVWAKEAKALRRGSSLDRFMLKSERSSIGHSGWLLWWGGGEGMERWAGSIIGKDEIGAEERKEREGI